jgi:hypothetical protein
MRDKYFRLRKLTEKFSKRPSRGRVQKRGWFVQNKDLGLTGDYTGNRDSPFFTGA